MTNLVIGKASHPLLRNLLSLRRGKDDVVLDWSGEEAAKKFRGFIYNLRSLHRRLFFPFYILFRIMDTGALTVEVHFVRKEILGVLVLRKIFGLRKKFSFCLVFWGTDIRQHRFFHFILSGLLDKRDKIVCTSRAMKRILESHYSTDIEVRYFPSPNARYIKKSIKTSHTPIKSIVIGNNGRQVQRHFDVLREFARSSLKENVEQVVFPLSYMTEIDVEELEKVARGVFPNAKIMSIARELDEEDYKVIYESDLYVNFQLNDAFSTFLIECLAAGLICVVANRSRYEELSDVSTLIYFSDIRLSGFDYQFSEAPVDVLDRIYNDYIDSTKLLREWL